MAMPDEPEKPAAPDRANKPSLPHMTSSSSLLAKPQLPPKPPTSPEVVRSSDDQATWLRRQVINEIVDTEEDYVGNLDIIVEVRHTLLALLTPLPPSPFLPLPLSLSLSLSIFARMLRESRC
jgi:hypothetical protein